MIRWLQNNGYFVSVRPIKVTEHGPAKIPLDIKELFVSRVQPEPIEILLSPPHHLPTPGKKTIYFTMWESSRLRPESIAMLKKADLVVVPSNWCVDTFYECGVKSEIVPLGIDTSIFTHRPIVEKDEYVFGTAGNLSNGYKRKGIDDVVAAFRAAFRNGEKVELQIKTTSETRPRNPSDKRISLNVEHLSDPEMANWYSSIDCYVSGSRSEGFGLMPLQAMAVGRPVIAARHTGQADYLNDLNSLPVEFKPEPAGDVWSGLGEWYKPSINSMAQMMIKAYNNRSHMISMGHNAAQTAAWFSWGLSNQMLSQQIQKLCPRD